MGSTRWPQPAPAATESELRQTDNRTQRGDQPPDRGILMHQAIDGRRQGQGGRTHLVSPAVAAATAIAGHFATPADLED